MQDISKFDLSNLKHDFIDYSCSQDYMKPSQGDSVLIPVRNCRESDCLSAKNSIGVVAFRENEKLSRLRTEKVSEALATITNPLVPASDLMKAVLMYKNKRLDDDME